MLLLWLSVLESHRRFHVVKYTECECDWSEKRNMRLSAEKTIGERDREIERSQADRTSRKPEEDHTRPKERESLSPRRERETVPTNATRGWPHFIVSITGILCQFTAHFSSYFHLARFVSYRAHAVWHRAEGERRCSRHPSRGYVIRC